MKKNYFIDVIIRKLILLITVSIMNFIMVPVVFADDYQWIETNDEDQLIPVDGLRGSLSGEEGEDGS